MNWSSSCSCRWLLVVLSISLALHLVQPTKGQQQFYVNGRYGRRNTIPPLEGVSRDLTVSFFGDASINCVYTGYQDYYRCSRKEESSSQSQLLL